MLQKKYFGVMFDMSRNGVMTVAEVKKYATIIQKMGYNMIQLYMEDVYEVENEPYFGYLRGRYTQEELKEIVSFCESIGVEVIPCVQTLAHLENLLRWDAYQGILDYDNVLLVGENRTYELIENIFKSLRKCFTTEHIHIGMDEAHMLGLGKYLDRNGFENRFEIFMKHLKQVAALAEKYNFKPMMWSDMFFRLKNNGEYYPQDPSLDKDIIEKIPNNIELVYWDYYHTNQEYYEKMMNVHLEAGNNAWFAGGAWTWTGFASGNKLSLETMIPAMKAMKKCGVEKIFFAIWGDWGRECSYYSVLPALFAYRKIYDGITDMEQIRKEFKEIVGEDFDAMMDLDLPNYVGGNQCVLGNVCKHMLYNDPFLGFLDSLCKDGVEEEYRLYAKKLRDYAECSQFDYVFENLAALCDVLSVKYTLGSRTRLAYKKNDKKQLKILIDDYTKTLNYLEVFYEKYKEYWFRECKPNGFEVHSIRLGGLKQRLIDCRERLKDYLDGKITEISELEEEILDYFGNGKQYRKVEPCVLRWSLAASVSRI